MTRSLMTASLLLVSIGFVFPLSTQALDLALTSWMYDNWDEIRDVIVDDGYAYLADMLGGVRVVDLSNLEYPEEVAVLRLEGTTYRLDVQDDYLYAACDAGGLRILNISNPEEPFETGFFQPDNAHILDVSVNNDFAYVADLYAGIYIVDVSDPAQPVQAGFSELPGFRHLLAQDTLLITPRLNVYSINRPDTLVFSGQAVLQAPTWDVELHDGIALVADGILGLSLVDVSIPGNPIELRNLNTPGFARGTTLGRDGFALVADGSEGVQVIDIEDPLFPTLSGHLDSRHFSFAVTGWQDTIALADGQAGLRMLELDDRGLLAEQGRLNRDGIIRDVMIDGNLAYVADGNGMRIVDISDPLAPEELSYYIAHGTVERIEKNSVYLHLVIDGEGVETVYAADPSVPEYVSFYYLSGIVDLAMHPIGIAYILTDAQMRIVNFIDPFNPIEDFGPNFQGQKYHIEVHDSLLLASSTYAFFVISLDDPMEPEFLSSVPREIRAFDVEGSLVHGFQRGNRATIIDISDPYNAQTLDEISLPGIVNVTALPGYTIACAEEFGLHVVNCSDPEEMSLERTLHTPGRALAAAVAGDLLVVADDLSLSFYAMSMQEAEEPHGTLPLQITLSPAWPNPFNAQTTVMLELPHGEKISLQLVNVLGQVARDYGSVQYNAGRQRFAIDGAGLASGIYFLRVRNAAGVVAQQRMQLLR